MELTESTAAHVEIWLAQLNAGDSQVRNELVGRMMERLHKLVQRMLAGFPRLRRFEDTDDVLQGMLIRLIEKLETVQLTKAVDFLRLAAFEARLTLIDLSRHYLGPRGAGTREKTHRPTNPDDMSGGPDPADSRFIADRLAQWAEFHEQIGLLPEEEGDVFAMIWYNDLTHDEVAEALGISVATVKRRSVAARERLQRWLKGDGAAGAKAE